jgi:hypothetical protein
MPRDVFFTRVTQQLEKLKNLRARVAQCKANCETAGRQALALMLAELGGLSLSDLE